MITIRDAIERSLQDPKKIAVGAVLSMLSALLTPVLGMLLTWIICIIPGIVLAGYLLTYARNLLNHTTILPEWVDIPALMLLGGYGALISLLWFLPALIVLYASIGSAIVSILLNPTSPMGGGMNFLGTLFAPGVIYGLVLATILILLTGYVLPAAILAYLENERVVDAFALRTLFAKTFTSTWLITWAKYILLCIGTGIALGIITAVFTLFGSAIAELASAILDGFAGFTLGLILYTLFCDAYTTT